MPFATSATSPNGNRSALPVGGSDSPLGWTIGPGVGTRDDAVVGTTRVIRHDFDQLDGSENTFELHDGYRCRDGWVRLFILPREHWLTLPESISCVASLAGRRPVIGILMAGVGFPLSLVGEDPQTGELRVQVWAVDQPVAQSERMRLGCRQHLAEQHQSQHQPHAHQPAELSRAARAGHLRSRAGLQRVLRSPGRRRRSQGHAGGLAAE